MAVRFDEPVWMNRWGNIIDKNHTVGYKVKHSIHMRDICVTQDKVGANVNMKWDRQTWGESF